MNEKDFTSLQLNSKPQSIKQRVKQKKAELSANANFRKRQVTNQKKLKNAHRKAKKEKEHQALIEAYTSVPVTPEVEISLPEPVKEEIKAEPPAPEIPQEIIVKSEEPAVQRKIIWQPDANNLPQIAFLQAIEEEVLYAGSRGGGKTDALIADPLRYVDNPNFKGLIIRKTMKRLREVMSRAKKIYLPAVPGTKWKEMEKMFVFPSGATIEFGYCDTEADLDQYIGQEYIWLGIDELTQYESDYILETLKQSLRSTDPKLKRQIRCTANPGNIGHRWVKERFIDRGNSNERIILTYNINGIERRLTRKWIHSTIEDNSILMQNDPDYIVSLEAIENETLKKQWRYGDWDTASGAAFSEFNKNTHVVKPFEIPKNWLRFRGCDWGYSSLAVCLWVACDYDNNLYVYRELVENGNKAVKKLTSTEFARKVINIEAGERVKYGVLDVSTWAKRGHDGPSIAEEMHTVGCHWRMSDSSAGSRIAGKMQIHEYLAKDKFTGKPRIYIFDNCKELISELSSIPIDDNNPEDVDTDVQDHAYDALRYAIMSRPKIANDYMWRAENGGMGTNHVVVSSSFGY